MQRRHQLWRLQHHEEVEAGGGSGLLQQVSRTRVGVSAEFAAARNVLLVFDVVNLEEGEQWIVLRRSRRARQTGRISLVETRSVQAIEEAERCREAKDLCSDERPKTDGPIFQWPELGYVDEWTTDTYNKIRISPFRIFSGIN